MNNVVSEEVLHGMVEFDAAKVRKELAVHYKRIKNDAMTAGTFGGGRLSVVAAAEAARGQKQIVEIIIANMRPFWEQLAVLDADLYKLCMKEYNTQLETTKKHLYKYVSSDWGDVEIIEQVLRDVSRQAAECIKDVATSVQRGIDPSVNRSGDFSSTNTSQAYDNSQSPAVLRNGDLGTAENNGPENKDDVSIEDIQRIYQRGSPWVSLILGVALLTFLILAFFRLGDPNNIQVGLLRFFLALTAALLSVFFLGGVVLKGNVKGLVIGSGGGFAIFILIQFLYNPFPERGRDLIDGTVGPINQSLEHHDNAASKLANINRINVWGATGKAQFVLEFDRKPDYRVFELNNPERIVVDVPDSELLFDVPIVDSNAGIIKNLRAGVTGSNITRIVVDVDKATKYHHYLLNPNQVYSYRIIFDLYTDDGNPDGEQGPVNTKENLLVAIDPGHGGEDPGEYYVAGVTEKLLSLQLAKRLSSLINRQAGMKAFLTRDGDYYVSLAKRQNMARRARADLLISVHTGKQEKGNGSIYVHNRKGGSSEAAENYAELENQADLIGGMSLAKQDDVLANVLLDLSAHLVVGESADFGRTLKASFEEKELFKFREIESGDFKILSMNDFPSILVNLPYYSRRYGANDIRSEEVQNKIVVALFDGIKLYLNK